MDPIVLIPIALVFAGAILLGRNIAVRRRVVCPRSGDHADILVLRRSWKPRKLLRVRECNLLPHPDHVDCGEACIRGEPEGAPGGPPGP